MSRFSQAISEGDGISVVPTLDGDVAGLAAAAEAAGAEAVAVSSEDEAEIARERTSLPILVRDPGSEIGAGDAYVVVFEWVAGEEGLLEEVNARLQEAGVECVVDVQDDEELRQALDRIDPDVVFISRRADGTDEEELERALDLLPDVPAGKLVIAESAILAREQVLALERAGVDALVVRDLGGLPDFGDALEDLVGGTQPGR
ncbi:MAG: hypothetical protein ICV74_04030 [Thermoleophilia bacterium]|nr:hypothetical protein [Thermoleophilia bacterium]